MRHPWGRVTHTVTAHGHTRVRGSAGPRSLYGATTPQLSKWVLWPDPQALWMRHPWIEWNGLLPVSKACSRKHLDSKGADRK